MKPALAALLLFVAAPARAQDAVPQIHVDALATYSIGSQNAFGGDVHAMASWTEWRGDVDGSLDVGVLVGYQAEPSGLADWIDSAAYDGIQHRVRSFVTLGETLRFGGAARELSFGAHVYAGLTYWESHGRAQYPEYGIDSSASTSKAVFDMGGFFRFAWRPHPVVGLSLVLGAPFFGFQSSYIVDLFTVGAGLAFRLH